MTESKLNEICSNFSINTQIHSYGNGHINDTYLCDSTPRFILQRINTNVFKNPDDVMENICNVTEHLKRKIIENGGDADRETLTVIPTKDGNSIYRDGTDCYRMYRFVEDTVSYDFAENPAMLYHAAKAFGRFQKMLSDFPAEKLHETIEDFHNTPERVNQLKAAISSDLLGRLGGVGPEVDFALGYAKYADAITSAMADGLVPLRVTHNDTKLNTILFDKDSGHGVCVIDLDTVMPGSLLYDFGDALRFGASVGAEDEKDLTKVWFDLERFEQFARGFLEEMPHCTETEIELMPLSALIMTYECGTRFLADHLNGDVYFKIHREGHNLDRARTQFKLVADIESKLDRMKEIVKKWAK